MVRRAFAGREAQSDSEGHRGGLRQPDLHKIDRRRYPGSARRSSACAIGSHNAQNAISKIYNTFQTFGEKQADKYLRELDAVFALIGSNPRMGLVYEGRTHQFAHGKHIILYRVAGDHVVIGRIFHGAQKRSSQ